MSKEMAKITENEQARKFPRELSMLLMRRWCPARP